jgi:DNA helicase II / ATP-dependent DNA helicase PcrA
LTENEFLALVVEVLGAKRDPNPQQRDCICASPDTPTMIVAGPGSGKTTVLVLRALRHLLVDRLLPETIMITTFTRKAAREIRSRLIEWGEPMLAHLKSAWADRLDAEYLAFLTQIDVNRFLTGTLDSLCELALADDRQPGQPPLVVLEQFAARVILQRRGGFGDAWKNNTAILKAYLEPYGHGDELRSTTEASYVVSEIADRLVHDRVDEAAYAATRQPKAQRLVMDVINAYRGYLSDRSLVDFTNLEQALFERLSAGQAPSLFSNVRALLVDEYQDTNALQEAIYFAIVRQTEAAFTIVGDDDQSLYRFRGATIELFRAFAQRCAAALGGAEPTPKYLTVNYRSTATVVDFFNGFVLNDSGFDGARIQPLKPVITPHTDATFPVVGMFRESIEELAEDLARMLHQIFRGEGFSGAAGQLPEPIQRNKLGGDVGDAVMLGSTVMEYKRPVWQSQGDPRLPAFLRKELQQRGLAMFNPRGRAIRKVPQVQQLLGLMLECIDPVGPSGQRTYPAMALTNEAKHFFGEWLAAAQSVWASPPPARLDGEELVDVVKAWQAFVLKGKGARDDARDWPVLDIIYSLTPWFPWFEDDPEGQVYLEAISRSAAQAAGFSAFRGILVRDDAQTRSRSVSSAIRDIIAPLAENLIDVDEELMPSVPRDRLNVMTIHQAKGLEFPLVIVDVGSDFKSNHAAHAFKRFPKDPSNVAALENHFAPFTPELGPLRLQRTPLQRTFDDLTRLYYVAYSRPQAVLVLVGTTKNLEFKNPIKNIAMWWRSDGVWPWKPTSWIGKKPPSSVAPPNIILV